LVAVFLKIAIIAEPPRVRSPFKISLKQASALKKRGHKVSFVTQERNLRNVESIFHGLLDGIDVFALRSVPIVSSLFDRFTRSYRMLEGDVVDIDLASMMVDGSIVSRKLLRARFDGLVVHSTLSSLSVLDLYRRSVTKKILHLHDIPIHVMMGLVKPRTKPWIIEAVKRFEGWAVQNADEFVCTTSEAAESWRNVFDIKPTVLHPGCDPSPSFPYPKKDYILSITSWEAGRAPFFLLDLMEKIKDTNLKLMIAGRWHDKALFEQFNVTLHRRNLQNKVKLCGQLDEKELGELYGGARCIVYPVKAKLVMTSLEAAAQGTPVLAPYGSGAWELFEPGVHGMAVEEENADDYIEGIFRITENGTVRKLGHAIWEKSQEYRWSNHVRKLEKILE
jgi:glycosyltransferase involved in cell wall biosynthesis